MTGDPTKTVWIYESGDTFKRFDTEDEAQRWLDENDPEGVAFAYELGEASRRLVELGLKVKK